jgi:hypothetical protein
MVLTENISVLIVHKISVIHRFFGWSMSEGEWYFFRYRENVHLDCLLQLLHLTVHRRQTLKIPNHISHVTFPTFCILYLKVNCVSVFFADALDF